MGPKPKIPVRERISPLRTPIREMPKVVCRKAGDNQQIGQAKKNEK